MSISARGRFGLVALSMAMALVGEACSGSGSGGGSSQDDGGVDGSSADGTSGDDASGGSSGSTGGSSGTGTSSGTTSSSGVADATTNDAEAGASSSSGASSGGSSGTGSSSSGGASSSGSNGSSSGSSGSSGSGGSSGGSSSGSPDASTDAAHDATTDSGAATDSAADAPNDAGTAPEAEAGPSGPPHRVFVTSKAYTGDLVSAANGLIVDAGIPAPDGGTFGPTQGRQAADAICQWHASSAGLPGTFKAVIYSNGTSPFTSMTDADGPWALVDGTPVAEKVNDLKNGYLHAAVDLTETGVSTPFGYGGTAYVWEGNSNGGYDCDQWTSGVAAPADASASQSAVIVGQYRTIMPWQGGAALQCNDHEPLHCIEVGSGGGPNVYPVPGSGSKLVFVTGPVTGDFAAPDGGTVDAGADAGTDLVHARADQMCAAAATAAGRSGTFHAYITSSTATGQAYFTAHSMNGPWVRPDGFLVASNLAALTGAGPLSSQISLNADGTFATGFVVAFTGTDSTGALVNNCNDYTTKFATVLTNDMYVIWRDFSAMWGTTYCNQIGKLACFEE